MSDHFNIDSLVKCIGCPIKLTDNMAFCGFCPIISVELKSPLLSTNLYLVPIALDLVWARVMKCFLYTIYAHAHTHTHMLKHKGMLE